MYRYRFSLPPIDYSSLPFVCCPFESLDWSSLDWRRFGSGGESSARHCFVDDWRLEHLWRRPGQGLAKAILHGVMTAPDFTIEKSFPLPVAEYQVFRMASLCSYWQSYGVHVVPVLQWGSPDTFSLPSKYIEPGSVVAVRGPQLGTDEDWTAAARVINLNLCPSLVLHFGRKPKVNVWEKAIYLNLRNG